ncbi:MAG TPA: hypothetical protein VND95_12430 [Stellaceae bacterium]|nr:hypothetical protein [Stellaceae bacterium]
MNKLLGALAAIAVAFIIASPPAAAYCLWHGQRTHCWHHRYHHPVRYYRPYYDPQAFYDHRDYPYAYYPAPADYRPFTFTCLPFGYFCL